jgi:hypothetical protein
MIDTSACPVNCEGCGGFNELVDIEPVHNGEVRYTRCHDCGAELGWFCRFEAGPPGSPNSGADYGNNG